MFFFERKKKGEVELAELFQDDLAGEQGLAVTVLCLIY